MSRRFYPNIKENPLVRGLNFRAKIILCLHFQNFGFIRWFFSYFSQGFEKLQKVATFQDFQFMYYLSVNMIGKLPRKKVENSVGREVKVRGHKQKH